MSAVSSVVSGSFDLLQFVSVHPAHGTVQPTEACLCKVTFTALGVPSFFDIDLVCEVRAARVLYKDAESSPYLWNTNCTDRC